MKKKWNKAGITVIASGLLIASACSDSEETAEFGEDNITFTMLHGDPHPDWNNMQDPVGQKIIEETGVTINAEFDLGGGSDRYALMAASGDYPDFISHKGEGGILINAGGMVDLEPLIEEHAPNIKALYG